MHSAERGGIRRHVPAQEHMSRHNGARVDVPIDRIVVAPLDVSAIPEQQGEAGREPGAQTGARVAI